MRIAIALCGLAVIVWVGVTSLIILRRRRLTRDLEEIDRTNRALAAQMKETLALLQALDSALTKREERDSRHT